MFSSIGPGPESRKESDCGEDLDSSCYERLLDTKIDKLQGEMRFLEAQFWENKLLVELCKRGDLKCVRKVNAKALTRPHI